jgi:MFS transporter, MCT family, solute carrier family 16 (monocarboxylic acid transporters), member 3
VVFIMGIFASGFTTTNIAGLLVTSGALTGIGTSALFMMTNTIPNQYFDANSGGRLGLANGLIKLGEGLGAATWSIALQELFQSVGISWAFRIYGLLALAFFVLLSWPLRGPAERHGSKIIDLALFRNTSYTAVFIAGAICVFGLYVPPFFLPLFAQNRGFPASTASGILAGFNLAATVGRFGAGPLCDQIGPLNTLLGTLALNAVSLPSGPFRAVLDCWHSSPFRAGSQTALSSPACRPL